MMTLHSSRLTLVSVAVVVAVIAVVAVVAVVANEVTKTTRFIEFSMSIKNASQIFVHRLQVIHVL